MSHKQAQQDDRSALCIKHRKPMLLQPDRHGVEKSVHDHLVCPFCTFIGAYLT